MEKKYMSVPEMAEYIGMSKQMAYQLAKIEDFPAIVLGEKRVIVVADMLDDWMHKQVERKSAGYGENYGDIE